MSLEVKEQYALPDKDYTNSRLGKEIVLGLCPECGNLIVLLKIGKYQWIDDKGEITEIQQQIMVYPLNSCRLLDAEIPEEYLRLYNEADLVLPFSPKASAALSRRLLQQLLRDKFNIDKHDLSKQIDEFLNIPSLPSPISGAVDAIRTVGNFAAHPLKNTNTGEIVEVEEGEADWILEVLALLLDYAFVQPAKLQNNQDRLNQKLAGLGKGPLKGGAQ